MSPSEEKVRVELTIYGRVHAASYQYRVLDIAEDLGIVGRIWYKADKTVGIYAEGEKSKIKEFIKQIKIRPISYEEVLEFQKKGELIPPQPLTRVEKVDGEQTFLPVSGKYKKFEVIIEEHSNEIINSLRTAIQLIDRFRTELYYNFQVINNRYEKIEQGEGTTSIPSVDSKETPQIITLEKGQASYFFIEMNQAPLILIKAKLGYVMCGYLNMNAANKMGDIAGRVTGVQNVENMLNTEILEISENAKKFGLKEGMKVREFLNALM